MNVMRESIAELDGKDVTTTDRTSTTLKIQKDAIQKDASPRGEDAIPEFDGNHWIRVYCLIPDIEVDVVVEIESEIVVADSEDDEDNGHSLSLSHHRMF